MDALSQPPYRTIKPKLIPFGKLPGTKPHCSTLLLSRLPINTTASVTPSARRLGVIQHASLTISNFAEALTIQKKKRERSEDLQRLIQSSPISQYTPSKWNIWWLCELSAFTPKQKNPCMCTECDLCTTLSPEAFFPNTPSSTTWSIATHWDSL